MSYPDLPGTRPTLHGGRHIFVPQGPLKMLKELAPDQGQRIRR